MKKRVTHDFETRSASDLRKEGAYKYSLHPTTQPTCFSFRIKGEPGTFFLPFEVINRPWAKQSDKLKDLWTRLILEGFEFSAHNAFFETCIYKNILVKRNGWPDIPFRQFRCTAAKAAACALPRNLEGAGSAMSLRIQKDKRGYVAMMKTCKPTRTWNEWKKLDLCKNAWTAAQRAKALKLGWPKEPPMFLEPQDDPDTWRTLYEYNKIDTRAEELLDDALPDLNPLEQEIWFLNQKLNWRGLRIDIPTVKKVVGMMEADSKIKLKELDNLTMGLVTKPGSRRSILEFLALDGIELPDIRAKTVEDVLKEGKLTDDAKRLLEIRKALSKTSTRKYQAFLHRANPDDRVRDILLYHGASTGRDTGTGIQPHNMPRGLLKASPGRPYATVGNVAECDPEMLKILYGDSLPIVFSAVIRNMIIPSDGHELFVADFSKIEVAVLWWAAHNVPGLKILRSGKDPYKYMAAANTEKNYEDIPDDSDDRQLGKAQILGCGFGMGWEKFQATAWDQYRLKLTEEQSRRAVTTYREANKAVPELWKAYETAAINAIESDGVFEAGKCKFFVKDKFLWIELPSGRRLAYREPEIRWRVPTYEVTEYFYKKKWVQIKNSSAPEDVLKKCPSQKRTVLGEPRKTVEFWAVNSKTKKWARERTWGGTLTENVIQAIARDLMMPAMLRLEKKNYRALLMVHDEGICEAKLGEGNIETFVKILCEPPSWAKGLPIEAKGWKGPRYRK